MFDSLKRALGRGRAVVARKAEETRLKIFSTFRSLWNEVVFPRITFRTLVDEGYGKHATVYACVTLYADTFPEPPLGVYETRGRDRVFVPHPAASLIAAPNEFMSEDEFWQYWITYAAVGGLVCVWKERNRRGEVIGLWPLHRGQCSPVPAAYGWLSHWAFDPGDGSPTIKLDKKDIIPYRWAIDPLNPLDGLSPLVACARAVDTGTEAMRYVYALLKNDAVPRTALVSKSILPDAIRTRMLAQYADQYGGDNRGMPMILEGQDASIQRIGSNLDELGADALHTVPDSWITMAYRVPAVLVGTAGGLQRSIQGAPGEMMEYWTEVVRIPRWRSVEGVFTRHLLKAEFGDVPEGVGMGFDTSLVRALAQDEIRRRTSITEAFAAGWYTVNEARTADKLEPVPTGNVFLRRPGTVEVLPDGAKPKPTIEVGKVNAIVTALQAMGRDEVSPAAVRAILVHGVGLSQDAADAIVVETDADPVDETRALPPPAPDASDGDEPPPDDTAPPAKKARASGRQGTTRRKAAAKFVPTDTALSSGDGDTTVDKGVVENEAANWMAWVAENAPEFAGLFEDTGGEDEDESEGVA